MGLMWAMCLLHIVCVYSLCGVYLLPPFTNEGELFCACYWVFNLVERKDLVRISGYMQPASL